MYGYRWGRGFGYGSGMGFGYARDNRWPGNPTPYCRAYPYLPRGWWKWGYMAENVGYYTPGYVHPYQYSGYGSGSEVAAMRDTLKQISDMLTGIEKHLSELEKVQK
jgi:hypothetical protein